MADKNESFRNWLVAEHANTYKVFGCDDWAEADHEKWAVIADGLTEEEAAEELVKRTPKGNTAP